MGSQNLILDKMPEPLNRRRCAICDHLIRPYNADPSIDALQYICDNCNSNVLIQITGSLLADTLYEEMRNDQAYRDELHNEIANSTEKKFSLSTTKLSQHFPHA